MNLLIDKEVHPKKTVYRYSYFAAFYWLYLFFAFYYLFSLSTNLPVLLFFFFILILVNVWKPNRHLKKAMKEGVKVSISGNKYSFKTPFTAEIKEVNDVKEIEIVESLPTKLRAQIPKQ